MAPAGGKSVVLLLWYSCYDFVRRFRRRTTLQICPARQPPASNWNIYISDVVAHANEAMGDKM